MKSDKIKNGVVSPRFFYNVFNISCIFPLSDYDFMLYLKQ